jgi:predicted amidohydrolase YtcJ
LGDNIEGTSKDGSLGRRDFVVLDRDPRKVDPKTIKDIAVLRTVIGGETVFEKR